MIKKKDEKSTLKQMSYYSGLGLQLAAAMCLFGGVGYWLDSKYGFKPWFMIIGIVLGAVGGMVSVIRAVIGVKIK
ncbi:MAG: AtpZ/AtpI family protein [Chlorobiota bacterium]|jgi:F0F1-type ATP synthase assembly protein I|nr:AtpZ/AtpI family protein [Chlorobiota bacterium]QQS66501.1 MAG: AtpZ/AtpI family protein [Chlorobiota bacterium]